MGQRYDHVSLDERCEIYRLHEDGKSRRAIGRLIGRHPSTISRELHRNSLPRAGYKPAMAERMAWARKRHILTDTVGLLLKSAVHSAGIQDRDGAACLFDKLTRRFPFLEVIIGDSAYAGDRVRDAAPRRVEIIRRSDTAKGFQVLPKRWIVERTIAWITANRRMARDFEHHAETANAFIQIAMIKLMSRRLARFVNS